MVDAIIDARVNDRLLYTRSNWPAVIANVGMFRLFVVSATKVRANARVSDSRVAGELLDGRGRLTSCVVRRVSRV